MASETLSMNSHHTGKLLKGRLLTLFVSLGVVFWFCALLVVRIGNAAIFTAGNPLLIVIFILAIPVSLVFLFIARFVSGVALRDMFVPVVIMTFTALFLDGLAIAWMPQFYSDNPSVVMRGAAWIMWGAGLGLLFGWRLSKRERVSS